MADPKEQNPKPLVIDTLADLILWRRSGPVAPIAMGSALVREIVEDYADAIAALPGTLVPDEKYRMRHAVKQLVEHNAKLAEEMNLPMASTEAARALGKLSPTEECVHAVTDLFLRSARREIPEEQAYRASIRTVEAHVEREIARAAASPTCPSCHYPLTPADRHAGELCPYCGAA